jgi:cyclic di-GMP phosphodiesterase Gmr
MQTFGNASDTPRQPHRPEPGLPVTGSTPFLKTMARLLQAGDGGDPFSGFFAPLHELASFKRAMVLTSLPGGQLECIAAEPRALIGLRCSAGAALAPVLAGTVAWCGGEVMGGAELPRELLDPSQPALLHPIATPAERGVLMVVRHAADAAFAPAEVAAVQGFALIASALLALRQAGRTAAENHELARLVVEAQRATQDAREELCLLAAVVDQLPAGVMVEAASGQRILVNAFAAEQLTIPVTSLASPLASGPAWRSAAGETPASDAASAADTAVRLTGQRALLTSTRSARIGQETMVLSTSVDITERVQVENELIRRASRDELTGLPNRSLVQERVEGILARSGPEHRFALAFIDVDNLKHINDFYSHAVGDALLMKLAQRIAGHLRDTDMLARISGDEFVLIIDPVEDPAKLPALIDHLLERLKNPFYIDGFEVFTSASIGVSIFPDHGTDYEALRRNADSAMYRAKSGAKGGAVFFDLAMGQAVTARMELEQRLRLAIRDRQFRCAFQPKVDIKTHEVVGLEALVRWCDHRGEIQGPNEFISLAVELGLIDYITHLVLTEATAAMDQIDQAYGPVTVSLNVAAKQAGNLVFMRSFIEALKATGHADRFMVELTEDAFIAKNQFQTEVLPLLREIGVRISIDDFGTGYSSLSALADITADEIKIDRSFITDIHLRPRSQSVLKAVESLSHALGMSVVAEGVETFEELAYLQAATRIRCAQGYYFARPFFLHDAGAMRDVINDSRSTPVVRGLAETRPVHPSGARYWRRS